MAGFIPSAWFNLTKFRGIFATNHAWRDFAVSGPTKKRTCPAHDEPNDSKPSTIRAPQGYCLVWTYYDAFLMKYDSWGNQK
ncbi:MAG: hypothetical protein WCL28_07630 [bacterium]